MVEAQGRDTLVVAAVDAGSAQIADGTEFEISAKPIHAALTLTLP